MTTTESYINRGSWLPGGVGLPAGQQVPILQNGQPIKFSESNELTIIRRFNPDSSAPDEKLVEGTHYSTVMDDPLDAFSGITITTMVPTVEDEQWLYWRAMQTSQQTDYTPLGKFPAQSHENALDRLTRMVADLRNDIDRCIRTPQKDTTRDISPGDTEIAEAKDRASRYLTFDEDGKPETIVDAAANRLPSLRQVASAASIAITVNDSVLLVSGSTDVSGLSGGLNGQIIHIIGDTGASFTIKELATGGSFVTDQNDVAIVQINVISFINVFGFWYMQSVQFNS